MSSADVSAGGDGKDFFFTGHVHYTTVDEATFDPVAPSSHH